MGYVRHSAIVATCWQEAAAKALTDFAVEVGAEAIAGNPQTNGYITVCITSDGSKEGWQESDEGDFRRQRIREWLNEQHHKDEGALYFEWCEVAYGDDDCASSVVADAWSEPVTTPEPQP